MHSPKKIRINLRKIDYFHASTHYWAVRVDVL